MTGRPAGGAGLFGRLARGLARRAHDPANLPPPRLASAAEAGALRRALGAWWAGSPARFRRLFLEERPLRTRRAERALCDALVQAGLAVRGPGPLLTPAARVVPFEGRFVATDLRARDEPDQVFTLMFEQVYFVRHLGVRPTDRVLEIGLGSGVNALAAARTARAVTGVDVNPRALDFARFNEALEPGPVAVDMRRGAWLDAIRPEERYDLVISNPPFEPVPPGLPWFQHSAGGPDGLAMVRELLRRVPPALAPGARLELITWSPGVPGAAPRVVELLHAAFPAHRLEVHELLDGPIDPVLERFEDRPGYRAWRAQLAAEGLTELWFLFLRSDAAGPPGIVRRRPEAAVREAQAAAALYA